MQQIATCPRDRLRSATVNAPALCENHQGEMAMKVSGRCHYGQISFEATRPPLVAADFPLVQECAAELAEGL
jgi:hypothetical protein